MADQEQTNVVRSDLTSEVSLALPDDFHVHLRDGAMLHAVAKYTAAQFARALVMPNLTPPVRTVSDAAAYRTRILAALPADVHFEPLMTLYLTETTTPDDICAASASGFVIACKLYPAGATTNSAYGVRDITMIVPVLDEMQRRGLVLCLHGEVTCDKLDVFEREAEFVRTVLPKLLSDFPTLKIVLEHATTAVAVAAVENTPGDRLAATLTPQHLLYSRNALFADAKIRPDYFCLPLLKREDDRRALLRAVSGAAAHKFFAGTDSAPHTRDRKVCEQGCAGVFNAPAAVELYAKAFEEADALGRLNAFLCENGARFYGLAANTGSSVVRRTPTKVENNVLVEGDQSVKPLAAGETLEWSFYRT